MKRLISLLLAALMLCACCLSFASCGSKVLPEFVLPENGYDGSEVDIVFYHTMGADLRKVLEEAIVAFNELYPNIHITHEQVGSYDDVRNTIMTKITVGDQPHIAYCYPDHVAYYNMSKATVKLDSLIASTIPMTDGNGNETVLGLTQEQIADFIPGYYAEGKQFDEAGTMYTLPLSKSTEVLYYNKTFFDANGLTPPKTWTEMKTLCEKILKIDPECIPLGYDSESNWFITMTEQLGSDYTSATGDRFIFDDEKNYTFMEEFRSWYEAGYVTTQELNGGKYTSELFTAKTGTKSYMSIGSSAGANHQRPSKEGDKYPFEVGIATIPQENPAEPKVISQGPSLCIFNKKNPQEVVASWLFVKYLTTDVKFQAKFSNVSGYVPVIQSVKEDPTYKAFLEKADGGEYVTALAAKVCLEQVDAYYTSPAFPGSSTARDQVGLLVQACFSQKPQGNETVKDMIKRLFAEAIATCEYEHPVY